MNQIFFESQNYREILKNEFDTRQQKNPKLSQSAFARFIGLTPAHLSAIFLNKKGLSKIVAQRIAHKLFTNLEKQQQFVNLAESEHGRNLHSRQNANRRVTQSLMAHTLDVEQFKIISEWHHLAILETIKLSGFDGSIKWIAKRLGLSLPVTQTAVERLVSLEILTFKENQLLAIDKVVCVPSGQKSLAIQNFHKQILQKAIQAIEEQSPQNRDFGTTLIALNSKEIIEAKKMIQSFRKEFIQKFRGTENKDKVFALSTGLFSLDESD